MGWVSQNSDRGLRFGGCSSLDSGSAIPLKANPGWEDTRLNRQPKLEMSVFACTVEEGLPCKDEDSASVHATCEI